MSDAKTATERYLAQVRKELSSLPKRDANDLVAELRSHLNESCAEHQDDAVVAEVLAEMGEPRELAQRMIAERIAGAGLGRVPLATRATASVVDALLAVAPLLLAAVALMIAWRLGGHPSVRRVAFTVVVGLLAAAWLVYLVLYAMRVRRRDFRTPGRVLLGLTTTVDNGHRRVAYAAEVAALSGQAPVRRRQSLLLVATLAAVASSLLALLLVVGYAGFYARSSVSESWGSTGGVSDERLSGTIDRFYAALLHRDAPGLARFASGTAESSATILVREADRVVLSLYMVHWGANDTAYVWERVGGESLQGPGQDRWRLATLRTKTVADRVIVLSIVRSPLISGDQSGQGLSGPDVVSAEQNVFGWISGPDAGHQPVEAATFRQSGGQRFIDENRGKTREWQDGPVERVDTSGTHGFWITVTALDANSRPTSRWRLLFEDAAGGQNPVVSRAERLS